MCYCVFSLSNLLIVVIINSIYLFSVSANSRPVANCYLIAFKQYFYEQQRRSLLSDILQPFYLEYSVGKRRFPPNAPSDFEVVRFKNLSALLLPYFLTRLKQHSSLKYVSRENEIKINLLSFENNYLHHKHLRSTLFNKRSKRLKGTAPLSKQTQPWALLAANTAWQNGYCGAGVRVGVFDTGLGNIDNNPNFAGTRVIERTNWAIVDPLEPDYKNDQNGNYQPTKRRRAKHTKLSKEQGEYKTKKYKNIILSETDYENDVDGHGHGTFVAGIIAAVTNTFALEFDVGVGKSFLHSNTSENFNFWSILALPKKIFNTFSRLRRMFLPNDMYDDFKTRINNSFGLGEAYFLQDSCTFGLAPDVDLYIFRVFTDSQVSYTSWFLDAFNYAIMRQLDVINLSIGGPDFMDQPFVDKVWELSANGILLISAIGNDGPLYGTLNNPADQSDVIGVGGIDANGNIARFSSRGMTTWELPYGYGRVKPDVVTFSTGVISSDLNGGCTTLSGTSVASPIITGVVAILIGAVRDRIFDMTNDLRVSEQNEKRKFLNKTIVSKSKNKFLPEINPASIKQALLAGAVRLRRSGLYDNVLNKNEQSENRFSSVNHLTKAKQKQLSNIKPQEVSIFEQGLGFVNLTASLDIVRRIKPQVYLVPSYLDLTDCPYFWPYCSQPLYLSSQPIIINVTILNSIGVAGNIIDQPRWHPYPNRNGDRLLVETSVGTGKIWPWVGFMALRISVSDSISENNYSTSNEFFSGTSEGHVSLTVQSMHHSGRLMSSELMLNIRVNIAPKPSRRRRILWDQFHNLRYPPGYIPRDDLLRESDPLDWHGDHLHTNFRDLYEHLRKENYFLEINTQPFTCFDSSNYGTLLIVDPEDEFFPEEITKLHRDVLEHGLSILVFAGWYNTSVMKNLRFFDANTKRWWSPETGGTNLPALNQLLAGFHIKFSNQVYTGRLEIGYHDLAYPSGSGLIEFPFGAIDGISGSGVTLSTRLVDYGAQLLMKSYLPTNNKNANFRMKATQNKVNLRPIQLNSKNVRLIPSADAGDPLVSILGLWSPVSNKSAKVDSLTNGLHQSGKIAVFGDSNCLDSSHLSDACFWLIDVLLQFVQSNGNIPQPLANYVKPNLEFPLTSEKLIPVRLNDSKLHKTSHVIRRPIPDNFSLVNLSDTANRMLFHTLPVCNSNGEWSVHTSPMFKEPDISHYQPKELLLYPEIASLNNPTNGICSSSRKLALRQLQKLMNNFQSIGQGENNGISDHASFDVQNSKTMLPFGYPVERNGDDNDVQNLILHIYYAVFCILLIMLIYFTKPRLFSTLCCLATCRRCYGGLVRWLIKRLRLTSYLSNDSSVEFSNNHGAEVHRFCSGNNCYKFCNWLGKTGCKLFETCPRMCSSISLPSSTSMLAISRVIAVSSPSAQLRKYQQNERKRRRRLLGGELTDQSYHRVRIGGGILPMSSVSLNNSTHNLIHTRRNKMKVTKFSIAQVSDIRNNDYAEREDVTYKATSNDSSRQ